MRAARTILHINSWISAPLMVLLMLWTMGGPSWQSLTSPTQDYADSAQGQDCDDQAPDEEQQSMLTSLEAGVLPMCKIQLAFFCSFIQEMALVEQPVERVAVDVPLPQSTYFRTLLRRIISPNAP